jgi:hypothetical protein
MGKCYHTLVIKEDGFWSPQFGDYDRETVESEADEYRRDLPSSSILIISTNDDQASINQGVAKLNNWRNPKLDLEL